MVEKIHSKVLSSFVFVWGLIYKPFPEMLVKSKKAPISQLVPDHIPLHTANQSQSVHVEFSSFIYRDYFHIQHMLPQIQEQKHKNNA